MQDIAYVAALAKGTSSPEYHHRRRRRQHGRHGRHNHHHRHHQWPASIWSTAFSTILPVVWYYGSLCEIRSLTGLAISRFM